MTATTNRLTDGSDAERTKLLVVDDEEKVADLYADFLRDSYDVTTVYCGADALEVLDASFDVVLLDRLMPDVDGDEVLEAIRSRNLDCQVAMVTAANPDLDIIELPFDDYVVKPVTGEELRRVVDRFRLKEELTDVEYELGSLRVKRNVLREELSRAELRESDDYVLLQERIDALRGRLASLQSRLEDEPGARGTA